MQADAYAGFNRLYEANRKPGPIVEAACWAHGRRKFFDLARLSDRMAIAAAEELLAYAREKGLTADRLLPSMGDWTIAARIAGAVGEAAAAEGLARHPLGRSELEKLAIATIGVSRACVEELVKVGLIPPLPT